MCRLSSLKQRYPFRQKFSGQDIFTFEKLPKQTNEFVGLVLTENSTITKIFSAFETLMFLLLNGAVFVSLAQILSR